ncbi:PLDc_N domain-containing protein [Salicibibacter cibi]|uniref:PLDc_N domain-containing protein n=1 Tax=Salicibibacter cibi TaxID=2743001 RepID=A0A7T7CGS4_9BACI|nr:PLD nuclease N-terminal domain-containing protein [Salicibibacter cibi]QQK81482.1 PLDc_N domain-containing protein [Salicibibacter cibi]
MTTDLFLLILPIVLIDLTLKIVALIDLYRRPRANGPKWMWTLAILIVSTFGPIIYFIFGRSKGA